MRERTLSEEDLEGEERRVYDWRLREFWQLTGSREAAERLAVSDADLGRARKMSAEGARPSCSSRSSSERGDKNRCHFGSGRALDHLQLLTSAR